MTDEAYKALVAAQQKGLDMDKPENIVATISHAERARALAAAGKFEYLRDKHLDIDTEFDSKVAPVLKRLVEGAPAKHLWDLKHPEKFLSAVQSARILEGFKLPLADFNCLVEYIFNHCDFFERLVNLVRYDCLVSLMEVPAIEETLTQDQILLHVRQFKHWPDLKHQVEPKCQFKNTTRALMKIQQVFRLFVENAGDSDDEEDHRHDIMYPKVCKNFLWQEMIIPFGFFTEIERTFLQFSKFF